MSRNTPRPGGNTLLFLTCVLAVPTVSHLLYGTPSTNDLPTIAPYLFAGAALGLAHLILRPLLRLITAPLGCMTFGLSGTVIDVALIYLSARLIPDFHMPGFAYALVTAIFINLISLLVGARK